MKKPDEIKKGLECCISDTYGCNEKCPYFNSLSNGVDCAVKMHADALAYIQQLEALVPRWIPVEERLPEKHRVVLVHLRAGIIETGAHSGRNWWNVLGIAHNENVTHWMALPEPPEEGKE